MEREELVINKRKHFWFFLHRVLSPMESALRFTRYSLCQHSTDRGFMYVFDCLFICLFIYLFLCLSVFVLPWFGCLFRLLLVVLFCRGCCQVEWLFLFGLMGRVWFRLVEMWWGISQFTTDTVDFRHASKDARISGLLTWLDTLNPGTLWIRIIQITAVLMNN